MIDTVTMLVSHGALLYVLWRLVKLRDPDDYNEVRSPLRED